jgi:hypothetical protein
MIHNQAMDILRKEMESRDLLRRAWLEENTGIV